LKREQNEEERRKEGIEEKVKTLNEMERKMNTGHPFNNKQSLEKSFLASQTCQI